METSLAVQWLRLTSNVGDTGLIPGWGAMIPHAERLLLNHDAGILGPGGEEFNLGPETRLDRSELLCNKVLLKYKGDRESF